ncbi:MAG TPA: zinc-ribbon and DUF3426 domain-containing protein, partial [Steroidobacteraceae bacterium]|nr:zinc-ribbon and DUF3426 domain-containing protein [Steroidobacteraceae bacterium]
MYTVCPKCALTLVVTAADLRVAQGYVRCGRCSSVFNALAQLSDERAAARASEGQAASQAAPQTAPQPAPQPQPQPQPDSAAAEPPARPADAIPEEALEFNPQKTDASSVFVAAPPNPEWTAATGSFKALVAANQEAIAPEPKPASANEELDIELDAALLSDIVEKEPAAAASPPPPRRGPKPAVAAAAAAAALRVGQDAGLEPAPPPPPLPQQQQQPSPRPPPEALEEIIAPFEPSRTAGARPDVRPWAAGAVVLALVLAAQLINHQRDALATNPLLRGPLTALYSSLGVPLVPHWDLHAYDLRQLGATVTPGAGAAAAGTITVRASIRNAGPKPQPLPLLRVTLQDRFGNRLASRDVEPRDYLPHNVAPGALMPVDQRIDAELAFVDPGSSAVGFELDACLPVRGG